VAYTSAACARLNHASNNLHYGCRHVSNWCRLPFRHNHAPSMSTGLTLRLLPLLELLPGTHDEYELGRERILPLSHCACQPLLARQTVSLVDSAESDKTCTLSTRAVSNEILQHQQTSLSLWQSGKELRLYQDGAPTDTESIAHLHTLKSHLAFPGTTSTQAGWSTTT